MEKTMNHRLSCLSATIAVLFCISSGLTAQIDTLQNPKQFLFPKFSRGTVIMKDGKEVILRLNYNIVSEKMTFIQNGQLYEMKNQETIDTVYLAFKKFFPVGDVFYEVGLTAPVSLFIQNKSTIQSPQREGPYGIKSDVSSTVSYTGVQVGNNVYKLTSNRDLIINPKPVYWLRINNSFSSFETETQLIKILPDLSGEIKGYVKQNKIKFIIPEDIINLIIYCNSLKK